MGEPETVIFVVGVAGSPLKLEDELFILQFMECLSTGFSWQVALGNQLHFYFYHSLLLVCHLLVLDIHMGREHCCLIFEMRVTKVLTDCPLETELLSPLQMPITSLYH